MHKAHFDSLMVALASTEDIEKWSNGSVELPDTINYRTGKPKTKGLFCETIFGPVKNYECSCGKYKGIRYKGIVCERCGVEVTNSRVRRERMGHIELASPVVHVWYVKATPSRVGLLLNLSVNEIEKILYYVKYVLVSDSSDQDLKNAVAMLDADFKQKNKELDGLYEEELKKVKGTKEEKPKTKGAKDKSPAPAEKGEKSGLSTKELERIYSENKQLIEKEYSRVKSIILNLKQGATIIESDYRNIFQHYKNFLKFESGPEAILKLLAKIDVEQKIAETLKKFRTLKGEERKKTFKLIKLLINLHISGVKPENMVIRKLPVIPPDLRPVVQLEGGKFAASDVNLFYRRVLMRNIRLIKMIRVGMPDVVKKNEVRLLQESVNNLLIGEKNNVKGMGAGTKVFKSLTDMLSGKEGIFRRNLLGKRVDYSGRSVITVGPDLRLDECGLPLYIAVKIFTPFIIGKLIENKLVHTPKQAEKLIKAEDPKALRILEEVIKDKYVLLNRAPTLHRLSIQAFKIRLMPGKTIRLHPLVCAGFNADFDGDQMAVHLPISEDAQREAQFYIASDKNILKPSSSEPIITHSQDMVLGIYYLTDDFGISEHPVGYFESLEQVIKSYDSGNIKIKDQIVLKFNSEYIKTSVGRVIFNNVLPEGIQFINKKITKKDLKKIIDKIFDEYGMELAVKKADLLKDLGFKYATESSVTTNIFDIHIPQEKNDLVKLGEDMVNQIYTYRYRGMLSDDEKHKAIIRIWSDIRGKIEALTKAIYHPGEDYHVLIDSGSRGSWTQVTQVSGMKGLVQSPSGKIIELPVKSCLVEGFSSIEYFIAAYGGRKGKADTALKTAESGYLTRKLCDSSQEVVIKEHDCHTDNYIILSKEEATLRGDNYEEMLFGRTLAEDITDNNVVIIPKGTMIDKENLRTIMGMGIDSLKIRSALTCNTISGVCQKCYGMDLGYRALVEIGTPVGILASQSIGEPGTQMILVTFHGDKSQLDSDMTQGIERVKDLLEIRKPKRPCVISPFDGTVEIMEAGKSFEIEITSEFQEKTYLVKPGYKVTAKKGAVIKKGGVYASLKDSKLKVKEEGKVISVSSDSVVIGVVHKIKKQTSVGTMLKVKSGDTVYKGQILTTGGIDIKDYKEILGVLESQRYIVNEIKKVYTQQGQDLNDKHIEIIVKQLFSKVFILDSGDSSFIPGTIAKYEDVIKVNEDLVNNGKSPSQFERLVLGLTEIAKLTDSWLSGVSFQETMRVMVENSLQGTIDRLDDLKANVIIGRLLPVGEIYRNMMKTGHHDDVEETPSTESSE